ncbi:glycosyltransferase family 4 protein [Trinickia dinghuensis]|uniref:Glycosyltransferase n=1 Tax=Trinickia dinghuensis TaxID=2291023 RepID=A0A3D8JTP1_9BURK|nr:glycosyltransferase family 4 protein [Trinickia dinghuensis]RDU96469.1 glycosyltransferase [Trinickia dinghuensis]
MKIGISANALSYGGGLERYAMDLVRAMAAQGVKPAFFARGFDETLPEYRFVEPRRIAVSLLPGKLRDHWFSWRLRRARRVAEVDVLIGCNRVDSSEIAICGGTHLGFMRATGRTPRRSDRWQVALEKRQYARAEVVVAHSVQMRDELRELYDLDEAKIRVMFPPVDAARFQPCAAAERAQLRKRFDFADGEIVLLFPSSSHDRKGLPLIEAALRGVDLPVVVAVAGRKAVSADKRIRYIGYVKDLEQAYSAADFTILASKYEPFGLVGVESAMCGTPVILSNSIGCCDAISDHAKLMFRSGDVDDLRATLHRAVQSFRSKTSAPPELAQDALRYDAAVASHVARLLELAATVRGGHARRPSTEALVASSCDDSPLNR